MSPLSYINPVRLVENLAEIFIQWLKNNKHLPNSQTDPSAVNNQHFPLHSPSDYPFMNYLESFNTTIRIININMNYDLQVGISHYLGYSRKNPNRGVEDILF